MSTTNDLVNTQGDWSGKYSLWLEPDTLRTQCVSDMQVRRLMNSRFLSIDYSWTDLDGPQFGSMLLGPDGQGEWTMALVDTWHTASRVLACFGADNESLVGIYGTEQDPWSWKTSITLVGDELLVAAWNVSPEGIEDRATEARYWRRSTPVSHEFISAEPRGLTERE